MSAIKTKTLSKNSAINVVDEVALNKSSVVTNGTKFSSRKEIVEGQKNLTNQDMKYCQDDNTSHTPTCWSRCHRHLTFIITHHCRVLGGVLAGRHVNLPSLMRQHSDWMKSVLYKHTWIIFQRTYTNYFGLSINVTSYPNTLRE